MRQKHQRRVLLNLLLTAVLALFLWAHDGCPLPTLEMELHRAERQALAEESRVVWEYRGRSFNDRDMLVGTTADSVHAFSEVYGLDIWPRSVTEPTLALLPDRTRYNVQGGSYLGPALLAVDPPAGAESAQLTMTISYSDSTGNVMLEHVSYLMEGEVQGGCFFFQLKRQGNGNTSEDGALWFLVSSFSPEDLSSYPYTLEFFDAGGALIAAYDNPAAGGAAAPER